MRRSPLVTAVGILNLLHGLLFLGWGVYALVAGAEAVKILFDLKEMAGPGKEAAGTLAAWLSAWIMASIGILAGCSFLHGLPLVLVGVGVLFRRGWARIVALVFGFLGVLEGVGFLTGPRSNLTVTLGIVFLGYGLLSFVALLGRRAAAEFGGPAVPEPSTTEAPMNAPSSSAPSWAPAGAMLMCAAGILLMALRPVTFHVPPPTAGPDGKVSWSVGPTAWLAGGKWPDTAADYRDRVAKFHEAAGAGQLSRVLEMLQMGASADDKDDKGRTALMAAAGKGHSSVVVALLLAGAQVNEKDDDRRTALMEASSNGHLAVARILSGSPVEASAIAALRGQLVSLRPTLKGKDGEIKLAGIDLKLPTGAVSLGNTAEIDARDKEGKTAYMRAVVAGHHAIASHLRDRGAAYNIGDNKGDTALHMVAASGSSAVWSHPLSYWNGYVSVQSPGAYYAIGDARAVNAAGRTPLMEAAAGGHAAAVRRLLEAHTGQLKAELLAIKDARGKAAIDLAREAGHKEVVAQLTTKESPVGPGEKPKALDAELAKAITARDAAGVEKLLAAGTSVAGMDGKGRSSILLAVEADAADLARRLIQHAAKDTPDLMLQPDAEGRTPLGLASSKGGKETFSAVLVGLSGAFGRGKVNWYAALTRKGKDGKSPLEAARARDEVKDVAEAYLKEQLNVRSATFMLGIEDAAERGDVEAIRGLLALGCTLDSSPRKNALMYAAEKGTFAAAEVLLDSFKTAKDRIAFIDKWYDSTPERTRQGYQPTAKTALEIAREKGHQEVVSLIERARARK